ncbi:MAG: hypothetical protein WBM09_11940 [Gallionella sp.]
MTAFFSPTLKKRPGTLLVLLLVAFGTCAINVYYKDVDLSKFVDSMVAITVTFLFFRIIMEQIVAQRIHEPKTRYSFRKKTHILFLVISFVIVLRI